MGKKRLFVDMDGTVAVFKPVNRIETLYEQGYFANLDPVDNVLQALKLMIKVHPEIEVYTLSAYMTDSMYAFEEKNEWLDKHLPEIKEENRFFCPCGFDKKDFVPGGIRGDDYLLDDYTNNLMSWQPPGRGIKLLNGINHTRGTWKHDRIRCDKTPARIMNDIVNIMEGRDFVRDQRPVVFEQRLNVDVGVNMMSFNLPSEDCVENDNDLEI